MAGKMLTFYRVITPIMPYTPEKFVQQNILQNGFSKIKYLIISGFYILHFFLFNQTIGERANVILLFVRDYFVH